jgi:hypothetical protein
MEDNAKQTFPEISIFTSFKLRSYLDADINETNNFIFITGKLFEHTAHKYNFKACEFYIYSPFNNKMFYSIMNSDECFTNSLKWNPNFFKKIRNCFIDPDVMKNTFYTVSHISDDNQIRVTELNDDDDIDLNIPEKNIYFEIYFQVEGKEINAFRLLLKPLLEDKPYISLINRLFEYEKFEEQKLAIKQKIQNEKENDLLILEKQIKTTEDSFIEKKNDYIGKFYLLLTEKEKKIEAFKK